MDDGQAVGLGTHEELLASCPVYQEIYYSQFDEKKAKKENEVQRKEDAEHGKKNGSRTDATLKKSDALSETLYSHFDSVYL